MNNTRRSLVKTEPHEKTTPQVLNQEMFIRLRLFF